MKNKISILRELLVSAINNIDSGNSNLSDESLAEVIKAVNKMNNGIKRISKREACEKILHCSPSTFDKYIALGIISLRGGSSLPRWKDKRAYVPCGKTVLM